MYFRDVVSESVGASFFINFADTEWDTMPLGVALSSHVRSPARFALAIFSYSCSARNRDRTRVWFISLRSKAKNWQSHKNWLLRA
jgi:hypothetical protein